MRGRYTAVALVAAASVFAAIGVPRGASAYPPPTLIASLTCASTLNVSDSCTLVFTLQTSDGTNTTPVSGVQVTFAAPSACGGVACGTVNPATAVTNASGQAFSTFTAGACGTETATASVLGLTTQTVIQIFCPAGNVNTLPAAAGIAPSTGAGPPWALIATTLVAVIVLLAAGGLLVTRRRSRHHGDIAS